MVNHPARSQKSPEAAIRRLISKHDLRGVTVNFVKGRVIAEALPHNWHPIVMTRRADAIASFGGTPSLAQLSTIGALDFAIAWRSGDTMDEAVSGLADELAKARPPPPRGFLKETEDG